MKTNASPCGRSIRLISFICFSMKGTLYVNMSSSIGIHLTLTLLSLLKRDFSLNISYEDFLLSMIVKRTECMFISGSN